MATDELAEAKTKGGDKMRRFLLDSQNGKDIFEAILKPRDSCLFLSPASYHQLIFEPKTDRYTGLSGLERGNDFGIRLVKRARLAH